MYFIIILSCLYDLNFPLLVKMFLDLQRFLFPNEMHLFLIGFFCFLLCFAKHPSTRKLNWALPRFTQKSNGLHQPLVSASAAFAKLACVTLTAASSHLFSLMQHLTLSSSEDDSDDFMAQIFWDCKGTTSNSYP